jgi:hypothetical protein
MRVRSNPACMSERWMLVGTLAVVAASVAVIATVRDGRVDVADGAVLVLALALLARIAIRLAADAGQVRRDDEQRR